MRFSLAAVVISCGLLASCAYQGVIVDKSARELPFGETIGIGGSLAFMLKDNTGSVHRQLVTPEVFVRYQVGDYFNDLQPGPSRQQGSSDGKTMLTAMKSGEEHASTRMVARHKTSNSHRVAKKSRKTHHAIAAAKRTRAKKIVPIVKAEQAHVLATVAELPRAETAYAGVTQVRRCR